MQLILYKSISAENVINKEMTEPLTMNINLRRGVDIVAPVLRIEYAAGVSPNKYNYCHIPNLGRYYFVRNIQSITQNLWELQLECDVLETYKTEILNSNARYNRNLKTGDYQTLSLESSSKTDVTLFESDIELAEGETIIMTTVGGGADGV